MDFAHCAIEQERVIHHDEEIFTLRKLDQFLRLCSGRSKWLFHKNVLSALEGLLGQREVRRNRRHDGDGIDFGIREYVGRIGSHQHRRVHPAHTLQRFGTEVGDTRHRRIGGIVKIAHDVRTPVSVTDDSYFQCR